MESVEGHKIEVASDESPDSSQTEVSSTESVMIPLLLLSPPMHAPAVTTVED